MVCGGASTGKGQAGQRQRGDRRGTRSWSRAGTHLDLGDDELLVELAVLDAVRHADERLAALGSLGVGPPLRLGLERQALQGSGRK